MALDRRPLKTRERAWPRALAVALARRGMTANGMSLSGVVAATACAGAIIATLWVDAPLARAALWLAAALGIQLRLVANLLDGLIAIEGGKRSPVGDLYNDVPDRVEDALALVPAGHALTALWPYGDDLGWAAIALAITTAYIRQFGVACDLPATFIGPMAKPQRMAAMTAGCVAAAVATPWRYDLHAIDVALAVVALGASITCVRRLRVIAAGLRARAAGTTAP